MRLWNRFRRGGAHRLIPIEPDEFAAMKRLELESRARFAVQPVYLGDGVAMCRVLTRYKCFVDPMDLGFGAHLLLDGYWESWITLFIAARLRPGDWTIDVGANHGYYTLLMADLVGSEGRVAAVEPNPPTCRLLRRSVALNGFANRVTVLEQAATAVDGETVILALVPDEPKNAHLVSSVDHATAVGHGSLGVAGGRLATALADWERLDFVKIDAEGAEEGVVMGLLPLLERHRPRMILEFHPDRCREPSHLLDSLTDVYGAIRHLDYEGEATIADKPALLAGGRREDWILYLE